MTHGSKGEQEAFPRMRLEREVQAKSKNLEETSG